MANVLSPWAIGQNVLITAQPLAKANSTYALTTTGTAQSFAGKIQNYSDDYNLHTSDLTPMDSFLDNPVIFGATGTYTLTEFESPLNFLGGGGSGIRVSVLRYLLQTSFYHQLTIQLGTTTGGTFTATNTETAYVQFQNNARNAGRDSVMRTATFQLITVADSTTGAYINNPAFS